MSEIEWEPCLLTQRPAPELERRFARETGRPGKLMRYFEGSPWLSDAVTRVSVQLMTFVRIDPYLVDQAGLVVSQDNSCRFCFGVQRAFLRVLGMNEKRIALLEQDLLTGDFNERERAALNFARRVSQSKPLANADDLRMLRDNGFTNDEIIEFGGLIGMHLFLNRLSTFVALPPQPMEEFPDHWWIRMTRPLVAFKFRRMRHRRSGHRLAEAEKSGPMSTIVNALDGLPMASELRQMIDKLWYGSSLPSRTISLMLAVVGRALGSSRCEQEAKQLLLDEDITEQDIDQILDHLSSPILSEVEKSLIPLARETVWYQPAPIQRHFADAQINISHEQFLDFVGAVALLNALCRLCVLVEIQE